MDAEELEKRTKGARKFVLENKTSKIQASKILDFADIEHKRFITGEGEKK